MGEGWVKPYSETFSEAVDTEGSEFPVWPGLVPKIEGQLVTRSECVPMVSLGVLWWNCPMMPGPLAGKCMGTVP